MLIELYGHQPAWLRAIEIPAYEQPDGSLKGEPPPPVFGARTTKPRKIMVPFEFRNAPDGDLQLLVPDEYLDFMLTHPLFRKINPPASF